MTMTAAPRPSAGKRSTPARSVSFVVFTLRFTEAGGVTVPGRADRDGKTERERAHALLDAGPDGRAQLPGTSLAGALRDLVRRERGETTAGEWFGRLLAPGSGGGEVDAQASRVWVLGSRRLDEGSQFRSSTKISRFRAAAQANTLRTEEVLPAGATFEVFLRWDDPEPGEVQDLASLIAGWRPFLGRRVSAGRGACVTEDVRYGALRLDEPGGLHRWLTMSGPDLARAVAVTGAQAAGGPARQPVLRMEMSIDGPWRIGSGEEPGGDGEPVPLFRAGGALVVPGSGIKGVFRSRAEFILRSLGAAPPPCEDQQCGTCWPCRVFGHGGGRDTSAGTVGARAAVRVPDAQVRDPVCATRTHVAIDRFTGGAVGGALYTMEALEAGTFTLSVDPLEEIPEGRMAEIRAVLRLVLQDLADGIIGMGGSVTRGYGTVKPDFAAAQGLRGLDDARRELARMARDGSGGERHAG